MTKSAYSKMLSLILTLSFATPYVQANSTGGGSVSYGYPSCDNPNNATGILCLNRKGELARFKGVDVNSGFFGTGRFGGEDVEYESKRLSKAELNALLAAQGGAQVNANGTGLVTIPGGGTYYPGNSGQGDCEYIPATGRGSCETRYVPGYAVADMPMSRREWRQQRRAYRKAKRAARRGANGQIIYVDADGGGGGGGGGGNIGPGGIIYGDAKADLAIIGPFCDGLPARIDDSADELKKNDEAIVVIEKELEDLKNSLDEKRKNLGCENECKSALTSKGDYKRYNVSDTGKSDKNNCYQAPNADLAVRYFVEADMASSDEVVKTWLTDSKVTTESFKGKTAINACLKLFPKAESITGTASACLDDIFNKNKDGKYTELNGDFKLASCTDAEEWMKDYNDYLAKQKTLDELKARKVKLTSKDGCKIRRASDADDDKWKGVGTACLESLKDSCTSTIDALIAIANNPNNGRCLECEAQQRGQGDSALCMMYGTCGMSKAAQIIAAAGGIINPLAGGLMNAWMYNKGLAVCQTMYADHLNIAAQIGQPPAAPGCGGMMGMGGGFNPMMGGMMGGMGGMMNPMMMGGMMGGYNPMMMGGMGGYNPMMMGGYNPMLGGGINLSLGGGFNPMMGGMGGYNPMMMGGFPGFAGGMYGPNMANQMSLQNQMQTSMMQMQQAALQQASLQGSMMYGMNNAANMYGMNGMYSSPYFSMGANPMMSMYGGGYPGMYNMYGGGYPGLSAGLNFNAGFNLGGGYGGYYGY